MGPHEKRFCELHFVQRLNVIAAFLGGRAPNEELASLDADELHADHVVARAGAIGVGHDRPDFRLQAQGIGVGRIDGERLLQQRQSFGPLLGGLIGAGGGQQAGDALLLQGFPGLRLTADQTGGLCWGVSIADRAAASFVGRELAVQHRHELLTTGGVVVVQSAGVAGKQQRAELVLVGGDPVGPRTGP